MQPLSQLRLHKVHHAGHAFLDVVVSCLQMKDVISEFMSSLRGHPYGCAKIAACAVISVSPPVTSSFDDTKEQMFVVMSEGERIML